MTKNNNLSVMLILISWASNCLAGGGVLLSDDSCIMTIGFYEAHFTAYQPNSSGDEQFCEDLKGMGNTIFVLDYLHKSLSEVPVDFRIIKNVTNKGEFVQMADIMEIQDLDRFTVFYQKPIIKTNASYTVSYDFTEKGEYVGIVTAGHPTNNNIYSSVFPFSVGASNLSWPIIIFFGLILIFGTYLFRMTRSE